MLRLTSLLCVGAVSLGAFTGQARADESYKEWWQFLKGSWNWEISPLDTKGTVTWRIAAKGNACVGRFKESEGGASVETSGWRADTKTYVVMGFGSDGHFWQLEAKKVTKDGYTASHVGVLPDGQSFKGTIVLKRIDDDHFTWESKGKMSDGTDYAFIGKLARKKE
jgi:hypothetical protein